MAGKDNFKFVIRRYDKNPNLKIRVGGYDEVTTSMPVEIEGVVACTAFLNSEHVFKRFLKLGWIDETERYKEWISRSRTDQDTEQEKQVIEFAVAKTPKKRGRKKKATT